MSSGQYGSNIEAKEETHAKQRELLRSLRVCDLLDVDKPWLLVKDGSLLGYFDWVPNHLRTGPWTLASTILIYLLIYAVLLVGAWLCNEPAVPFDWTDDSKGSYPEPFTILWWYNAVGFVWMSAVMVTIYHGPNSTTAWATYTVQSWTIIAIRHGLSTLAPFLWKSTWLIMILEYSRFPALATASVTSTLWNFFVGPLIYIFGMKTEKAKKNFRAFFFCFRLTQLHVFNIVYATINCVIASPSRALSIRDFYVGAVEAVAYVLFYLLILDRLGVHLYPVFSPRTPWFVVSFAIMLGTNAAFFFFWSNVLVEGAWRGSVLHFLGT